MRISKIKFKDSLIVGAALFSMFFGAGNMIFPPYLGFSSGTEWIQSFLSYFITDIGLVVVTLMAIVKGNGQRGMLRVAGKGLSAFLLFIIIMCLGPVISIPRTAATTYELSILPIFGQQNFPWAYVLFFLVVLILCINKGKIIDLVGKILTPVLILGLLVLIIKGIATPVGEIDTEPRILSPVGDGIEAGYQSMDVLGAVVFGSLIIGSVKEKGHRDGKSCFNVVLYSSLIAAFGLFVVYFGLTYLGATACGEYTMHISRTELLTNIINRLFPGKSGLIFFGIVAGSACITTAVALTGSAAEYLEKLFKHKVSYKALVIIICVFDMLISTVGVERLVSIASPLLSLVYPPILVSVVMSFFADKLALYSRLLPIYTALACGFYDMLASIGFRIRAIDLLPLNDIGLTWVIPSTAMFFVGVLIDIIIRKNCRT